MKTIYKQKSLISLIILSIFIILPIILNILGNLNMNIIYSTWPITNYILAIFGFLLLLIDIIYEKPKITKLIIISIIYLTILLLACIFSNNPSLSLFGSMYRNETYFMYLAYFIFLYLGTNLNNEDQIFFIKELIIITVIISLITGFSTPKYSIIKENLLKNVFYNVNHLGYYLSISSLLGAFIFLNNKKHKYLYLLFYIISIAALISNNTFGSYLGILISLLILLIIFIKNKQPVKNIILIILPFILLSLFITNKNNSIVITNFKDLFKDTKEITESYKQNKNFDGEEIKKAGNRMELWTNGVKIIKERPLLGYGLENIQTEYAKYNVNADRPHNCFLEIWLNMGVIGVIIYLYYLLKQSQIIIKNIKTIDNITLGIYLSTISYFISSLFGNSMFYTTPYYFIFIGILINRSKKYNILQTTIYKFNKNR